MKKACERRDCEAGSRGPVTSCGTYRPARTNLNNALTLVTHPESSPVSGKDLIYEFNYDAILVFVDMLSKAAIFLPTLVTLDAKGFAQAFVDNVLRRWGLPDRLITDRGSVFTSGFWRTFSELIGTHSRYSTSYHPQTDGQTERVNQVLEQYIRLYVQYDQSDWALLLPQAEFCYNSTYHSSIKMSPFEALHGFQPRKTMMEPISKFPTPGASAPGFQRGEEFNKLHKFLVKTILYAQEHQKKFYDKRHRHLELNTNDQVLVSTKNIKLLRPSRKLGHKFIGPFRITSKINDNAFELDLPEHYKQLHNVFPIAKLKIYHPSSSNYTQSSEELPSEPYETSPPLPEPILTHEALDLPLVDLVQTPHLAEGPQYQIEAILGERTGGSKEEPITLLEIKWFGYGLDETTWETQTKVQSDQFYPELWNDYLERKKNNKRFRVPRVIKD